jgi:hypothetical protein
MSTTLPVKSLILNYLPLFTSVIATLNHDGTVGAATTGMGSKKVELRLGALAAVPVQPARRAAQASTAATDEKRVVRLGTP